MTQPPPSWGQDPDLPPVPTAPPPGGWSGSYSQWAEATLSPADFPVEFRPVELAPQAYPPPQYPPPSSQPPARRGAKIASAVLGVVIVIVALFVAGDLYERSRYTPQKGVQAAFAALQSGSVSAVANESLVRPGTGPLLTDAILRKAVAGTHPLHNLVIGNVVTHGSAGTAVVNYDLGSVHQELTLQIARDNRDLHLGRFAPWKAVSLTGYLDPDGILGGVDNATVNGVAVRAGGSALPGWYDVTFADPNGLLQAAGAGAALMPDQTLNLKPTGPTTVTPAGTTKIITALTATLATCAASTDPDPVDCPFGVPSTDQDFADQVKYTILGDPTGNAKVTGYDTTTDEATVTGVLSIELKYRLQNETDGSYNARSDTLTSTYSVQVTVDGEGIGTYFDFGSQGN